MGQISVRHTPSRYRLYQRQLRDVGTQNKNNVLCTFQQYYAILYIVAARRLSGLVGKLRIC